MHLDSFCRCTVAALITRLSKPDSMLRMIFGRRGVLRTPIKFVFAVAVVSAMATMTVQVSAQEPAAQAGAKNWKDRGEYDLYDSILKDTTPQTRLDKLNQ